MTYPSQVDLWLIDIERDGAAFARLGEFCDVLSPADHRRLVSYARSTDAMAFAASRAALHQVLDRFGAAPGTRLHRTKSGKPFVPGLPAFSLSRTRGHALIGVNPFGGVGVDIETTGRFVPKHRLIGRVAALLGDDWPTDRRSIAAWTVVEAWTKLHGLTLAEVLDSPGRERDLEEALESKLSDVRLAPLGLPDGLVGACWSSGSVASVALRELEPDHSEGKGTAGAQSYPNALA